MGTHPPAHTRHPPHPTPAQGPTPHRPRIKRWKEGETMEEKAEGRGGGNEGERPRDLEVIRNKSDGKGGERKRRVK